MCINGLLYVKDNGVIKMMETYRRVLLHNKEGKLVKDSGLIPSHSYIIQFLELIYSIMRCTNNVWYGDMDATDVDNAESRLSGAAQVNNTYGRVNAGIGDDTFGIVVGTNAGTTPEDNENYKLDTKILHSAIGDAGELNYQAVTFVAPSVQGANIDFDITRTFLNETGVTITVKEIGIICKNITDTKYHLMLRDVVSDEAVLDGYTLTVVYTLRTTV